MTRILVVLALLGTAGCNATLGATLQRAEIARGAAGDIALTAFHVACSAKARACPKGATAATCPEWARCSVQRDEFLRALSLVGVGLAAANRVVYTLGLQQSK